jgi:hypothetical protein
MCRSAVDVIMQRLNGKDVDQRTVVPTELMVQESCGCRAARLQGNTGDPVAPSVRMSQNRKVTNRPTALLATALTESLESHSPHPFLDALDIEVRLGDPVGRDTAYWQRRLDLIGQARTALLATDAEKYALEQLIGLGRIFLSDLMERRTARREERQINTLMKNYTFTADLATASDHGQIANVTAGAFRQLMSIESGHLILLDESGTAPDAGRVLVKDNQPAAEAERTAVSVTGYVADLLVAALQPRALICNLLKCGQDPVGVTICEAEIPDLAVLLNLRNLVGNQIMMVRLLDKVRRQAGDLSTANNQLIALRAKEQEYLTTIRREMDLARQIQNDFLPQQLPALTGWEMAVLFQPAIEVAGDFYDVFLLPNGRTGIVIADVSGKSVGAALFMALVRSLLRALSQTTHAADPLGAISYVNEYIMKNHRGPGRLTMFVTLFYGLVDQATGELTYINAGHPPPVIT